ncbi:MAG: TIGR03032 family protein [Trichodesmium sp. MAG_R02]|nr:TIGR03032 family protein [Trichodesmium sp. MAG_R02]
MSKLAPKERCHLNGLAIVEGQLRYVTAISPSDVVSGWHSLRDDTGVVIDIQQDLRSTAI